MTKTIQIQKNGMAEPVVVDMNKLSEEIKSNLIAFGLQEKASNALANAKANDWEGAERTQRVQAMVDSLYDGVWSMRGTGGGTMTPLEAEIAKLAYAEAKRVANEQCQKPDDGFPTKKIEWLAFDFTKNAGGTIKGSEIVEKLSAHEALVAQAEKNIAVKAQQKAIKVAI